MSVYASGPFIQRMPDGTIKHINPFSGTQAWTVPGRGNRPLHQAAATAEPLQADAHRNTCAFCSERTRETPPEKSRWTASGLSTDLQEPWLFRRVANLFEIVSYEYWQANYGFEMDAATREKFEQYCASPDGRTHLLDTLATKRRAAGQPEPTQADLPEAEAFFGGGHDLIIGRRHYVKDATTTAQLASAGTLTPEEHFGLIQFTVDSMQDLYARNRYVKYVSVFQNWLKPAGASFDHLHKQLVALDERGASLEDEIVKLRHNPNMYNEWAVDYAAMHNLIIAENDHAVCFAGFGHRYPTLEVFSKSATSKPWQQNETEIRGMSDLIHACHAATGAAIACNEEWHHQPADLDMPMPWRVLIKWRVSNLAGFEGGTKIHVNTLSPWDVRDRVVHAMYQLRDAGKIAKVRIATECELPRNSLLYNPYLHPTTVEA